MAIHQTYEHAGVEGARVGLFGGKINTTFVLYRIGSTLIDTGPPNQWAASRTFIDQKPPDRILLTHHHEDHSGNAARLAQRYGITPLAPELSRAKLARGFRIPPIQRLIWGTAPPVETEALPERIDLGAEGSLAAIAIPGHAKDLHCFWWEERGFLFSGDLYVSKRLTHLRADEDLGELIRSIDKMCQYEIEVLFCSHRGIVENGRAALQKKSEYLKELCGNACRLHGEGVEEAEIVRRLLGPEDLVSRASFYNISKRNLIRQGISLGAYF